MSGQIRKVAFLVPLIALFCAALFLLSKKSATEPPVAVATSSPEKVVRYEPNLQYEDYENLSLPLKEPLALSKIDLGEEWLEDKIASEKTFPAWSRYYLPDSVVTDVVSADIDRDGTEETIVLSSCAGCNDAPRRMDIYKGKELIFRAGGAILHFYPLSEDRSGFVLGTLTEAGFTLVTFYQNAKKEFYVEREEDELFE